MCLVAIAIDAHPRYRLVVASNRDEFRARATAAAHWWPSGMLAGRDEVAGGTWFGVTRWGTWALVTNYREGPRAQHAAPSRGSLVPRVLADPRPLGETVAVVAAELSAFHGCNLVAGGASGGYYASNRADGIHPLGRGLFGLSNALLDTPWPKVTRVKSELRRWLEQPDPAPDTLFELLADRERPPDEHLPDTGIGLDRERLLSSPFIAAPDYGTHCSTVLTIDREGRTRFVERRFDAEGQPVGETRDEFLVPAP